MADRLHQLASISSHNEERLLHDAFSMDAIAPIDDHRRRRNQGDYGSELTQRTILPEDRAKIPI
jgi:hypothetical protein